jgi:hypothetical protein
MLRRGGKITVRWREGKEERRPTNKREQQEDQRFLPKGIHRKISL